MQEPNVKELVNRLGYRIYTLEAVVEGLIQTLEATQVVEQTELKSKINEIIQQGLAQLNAAQEQAVPEDNDLKVL